MKVIHLNKIWFSCAAIVLCLLAVYALFDIASRAFYGKSAGVMALIAPDNTYQVRSTLLMEAMDRVGACDPKEAAEIWASGLEGRSAALQYAVMDEALKAEYARQLETSAPNWVTGGSSPWVESYQISKIQEPGEDVRIIHLTFSTLSSTGPAGDYKAILTLAREGNFWRITKIVADRGLYPYTGFNP